MLFLIAIVILLAIFIVKNKNYKNGAYYQSTKIPLLSLNRDIGKFGEYLTYKNLRYFEKNGAKFLFNVYIPKSNGETTEIDVLMLSQKGIFVFESKNYSGWIFGNENQKNWYQTLSYGKGKIHKESFYNPIMQNHSHIKHLKALINEDIPMHSIIVFSERCTLKDITIESSEIHVIKRNQLTNTVSNLYKSLSQDIMTDDEVINLYNKLYPYTQVTEKQKMQHIANIQYNFATESANKQNNTEHIHSILDTNNCPICGEKLVLRTATKGTHAGNQFWGCSNFPKCKYIKNIEQT